MGIRVALVVGALALSACSREAAVPIVAPENKAASSDVAAAAPPPTSAGVYVYGDCEGEGGCPNRNWRTREPTPMLVAQSKTSNVLATLAPGEWVTVETVETRLIPVRGVVRAGGQNLRAGEVVYQLEYEGEGVSNYWVRGAPASLPESVQVDWDPQGKPPAAEATLGLWARVKRQDGQVGWVHAPQFECMGKLAGDENCRD